MGNNLSYSAAIRRSNVLFLLDYYNMSRYDLCDATGIGYTQLCAYLRPNNAKSIGNKSAPKFEKAFSLEEGGLDRDQSKELPAKTEDGQATSLPKALLKAVGKPLDHSVMSVPLFVSNQGIGKLSVENEPYLEETMIKLSDVYHQNIQPKNVKAFKVFGQVDNIPHKATVFLDSSINSIDLRDSYYLVCINGQRKVMKLDWDDEDESMLILGRLFHVEYSL